LNKEIKFRQEQTNEFRETETMLRDSFWNGFAPGCVEHYLMHIMRPHSKFVTSLDMVAVENGKVIGCAAYLEETIKTDDGSAYTILCLGPIAVHPKYQKQGIGGQLIEFTRQKAKKLGYNAIILYGDPGYYSKYGFVPAKNYKIRTSENKFASVLQICNLTGNTIPSGMYIENEIYNVDMSLVNQFDAEFPYKEKLSGTPSQLKFQKIMESDDTGLFKN